MSKCMKQCTRKNSPSRAIGLRPTLISKGRVKQFQVSFTVLFGLHISLVFTCSDPELPLALAKAAKNCLKILKPSRRILLACARTHGPTTKPATATDMDPIQINLSAPIYGKKGTGVGPSQPDESVEEPSGFLAALTSAFKRKLAKSGPQGNAMKAMFGKQRHLAALHS
jgi:hypothetical protein